MFDGGGIFPDVSLGVNKNTPIMTALSNDNLIFDFATRYYYNHSIEDISSFVLDDSDFKDFKDFLITSDFSFETETEKKLYKVLESAQKEELDDDIEKEFQGLIQQLNNIKSVVLEENKAYLLKQMTDEIVKRYVYREGLYDYYKIHDAPIKKAMDILKNPAMYSDFLR